MYVTHEEGRTLGVVFANDHTGETCLVTLDLRPRLRHMRATVVGVASASGKLSQRRHDRLGLEFDVLTPLRQRFRKGPVEA